MTLKRGNGQTKTQAHRENQALKAPLNPKQKAPWLGLSVSLNGDLIGVRQIMHHT
jgi:hypothetical protein